MNESIFVQEGSLLTVVGINALIPEFRDERGKSYSLNYFAERISGRSHLILTAYYGQEEAGYLVAYDKFFDGSFYCWMAGVIPDFRRKGVLTALMDFLFAWARKNGYREIKITTRNSRREMLMFLIQAGFDFLAVEVHAKDNRILLKKAVSEFYL